MRTIDLSPLYRASVGFDRLFQTLDQVNRVEETAFSYPPYNIEKVGEDAYRIVMAVAGFGEGELDITAKENSLVISGKKEKPEGDQSKVLHRGIAGEPVPIGARIRGRQVPGKTACLRVG